MADVKDLKEVALFTVSLVEGIAESLKDGKASIADAFNFVDAMQKAGDAIDGLANVPKELADLTDEEVSEITAYVKDSLDLDNDFIESTMEDVIDISLKIAKVVGKYV